MADITGLLNSGADLEEIIKLLYTDFQDTVGRFKDESKTAYQEAIEAIEGFYTEASEDRDVYFQDRYNLLAENLANLCLDFCGGDLANQRDIDQTYLTESADNALANDLAWFEKMQTAQADLYNAMLTEMAANIALTQAVPVSTGGFGSGGGNRGGNRGSNNNPQIGDWDETTSVTLRNDFERDFPGFIESVQEGGARGLWTNDQWAYFNDLIDEFTNPKQMIGEIIDDVYASDEAAAAAQRLIEMLATGSGGQISQPLPVGDGTFVWETREIPSINSIEGIEDLDTSGPLARAVGGTSLAPENTIRNIAQNHLYIASPTIGDRLDEIDSTRTIFDEFVEQRRRLEEQATQTIEQSENFVESTDPIRQFLRNWDPIRGWVNTEQTADEYWRSQNKVRDQPAPPPIESITFEEAAGLPSLEEQGQREAWYQRGNIRPFNSTQAPADVTSNSIQEIRQKRIERERARQAESARIRAEAQRRLDQKIRERNTEPHYSSPTLTVTKRPPARKPTKPVRKNTGKKSSGATSRTYI